MAVDVIMPKFGMAQEEGTILRWLKHDGDRVEKGEPILEVQTDKVDMEVEAPATGILRGIRFGADVTVAVTTVLSVIETEAQAAAPAAQPASAKPEPLPAALAADGPQATPVARRVAAAADIDLHALTGTGVAGRITRRDVEQALTARPAQPEAQPEAPAQHAIRATPAARRLARAAHIVLASIPGTGPNHRIQAADVRSALKTRQSGAYVIDETHKVRETRETREPSETGETRVTTAAAATLAQAAQPAPQPGVPLRGMRKTIAARMSQSWQTAPHIFLTATIDLTAAEALRQRFADESAAAGARITLTTLIAKVAAVALTRHPRLNAWLQPAGPDFVLTEHATVDLGIAVALADGLIVPVVRNAAALGLAELGRRIADLSQRARAAALTPDEVTGATFTISNLGMYPIDHFTALINPPQVAILAVGRSQIQPVWDGTAFAPRPTLQVTLSADHRAVDGAVAADFLADIKALLEEPLRLLF